MGLFDKALKALQSDQGKKIAGSVVDKAGRIASERTGGKHDDKIQKAKDAIDRKLGNEGGPAPR